MAAPVRWDDLDSRTVADRPLPDGSLTCASRSALAGMHLVERRVNSLLGVVTGG